LRPKLIIIAGPNGSGKTTFTPQMLQHDWSDGCMFINPDEIAKNEFGDWNSPEAVFKAVVRAQEMREGCLKTGRSMLIESVFSAPDKLDFIRRARVADFFIRFFFIGTDSPEINAARVTRRVLHGGHEVPIAKIISRYSKSIANASAALLSADRGYVYDNSITDRNPRILFRVRDGEVFKEYSDLKHHQWAQMMCEEVRSLAG
jgi:predicted ABC-type ATPase